MTFTRRALLLSAGAAFAGAAPVASQQATPTAGTPAAPVQVFQPTSSLIDLWPYAPGWQPNGEARIGIFARRDGIVMEGFDLGTGEQLWSADLLAAFPDDQIIEDGFTASPRWGETVAIGHTNGADLFAVDAATGEALWHLQMNSPEGLEGNMSTSFALPRGRIVGMSSGSQLFSRDERTAEVQWATELPIERLWDTIRPPVVSETSAYLVDDTMRIHGVGLDGGELLWTRQLEPEDLLVEMQTFGDAVLANLEWEGVKRLDPETGDDLWSNPDFLPFRHVLTVANGAVVIGIQPTMDMITAIDLDTGETLWKREPDDASVAIVAQASNDSVMAIADHDNRITALDAATGEELWVIDDLRLAVAYPQSVRALALTDDWLFVSTDDQRITIIDLSSGTIVNRTSLVGITDGVVPVDLWHVQDRLLAHASGLSLAAFTML